MFYFRYFVVSPPMYRTTPVWYLDGLSEVMMRFSTAFPPADRPRNLIIISSFPNPALESDGVHLNPYSGFEYVLHLFDRTEAAIASLSKSPESFVIENTESIRALENRVVVLEKDHQRLNKVVEDKTAVDAEVSDFMENKRNEDLFLLSGLPRVPSGLSTKDWQSHARKDVLSIVSFLLNREAAVKVRIFTFVSNLFYWWLLLI